MRAAEQSYLVAFDPIREFWIGSSDPWMKYDIKITPSWSHRRLQCNVYSQNSQDLREINEFQLASFAHLWLSFHPSVILNPPLHIAGTQQNIKISDSSVGILNLSELDKHQHPLSLQENPGTNAANELEFLEV